ncbi:sigma-70 family RNA polymerase sigma factor [Roseovarius aestuariivivens]|uniref:sigma-70 family RNA polymerase sigma factor n=1 Tax=Roseovarius aestuariivivens TaxID=1888910 RepID=UPI00108023CC|nr:sigma-70 family RNA polymerase sigma factor [Roseovarius aestuariivivens]
MDQTDEIESLLSRTALGDRQAFSQLYDRTSGKLFGVAMRVLRDKSTAEDVLQESYIKIWRYAERFAAGGGVSPMGWMVTIARNTAIDRLRAGRDADDIDEMSDRLADRGPTPEQVAEAAGEAGRISTCLSQLDDPRDKAVRGAYLEGLSYAELAEKFSVPLNTVRTWLRRSLISLRECMDQ